MHAGSTRLQAAAIAVALGFGFAAAGVDIPDAHEGKDETRGPASEAFERGVKLYLSLPPMADVPRELAAAALVEFQQAYQGLPKEVVHLHLPALIWAAFDAGQYGQARAYADEALTLTPRPWADNSDGRYAAHLVLGHLALDEGDSERAARHLTLAGQQTDQLMFTWGPNVSLARQLIKHGQREAVAAYFEQCAGAWSRYFGWRLKEWAAHIRSGHIPNIPKPSAFMKIAFPPPTPP